MSAEARYLRVGLFVFLGIALVVGGVLILGGSNLFKDEIQLETYFEEPVTGLEVGSPLRLRGVKLGEVTSIDFVSLRNQTRIWKRKSFEVRAPTGQMSAVLSE